MDSHARLDALTGLRFAAALGVAVAHLPYLHADPAVPRWLGRVMAEGGAGVPFFFVLSGFVLTYAYHAGLAGLARPAVAGYYVARVARIWPVHLLTLGMAMALPVGPQPGGVGPAITNALLVHNWVPVPAYYQSYNSVSWTLSIEAFFYLLMPLLLWVMVRWRSASPTRLTLAAVGVWLVQLGWVTLHKHGTGPLTVYAVVVCPAARVGEFAVGMLLALAFLRSPRPAVAPTGREAWRWTLLELAAVAAVLGLMAMSHKAHPVYRASVYYVPALAAAVAVFARQRGWVSRALAARGPVLLGDVSFALFMLHPFAFVYVGDRYATAEGTWVRAGVSLAAALGAAVVVHRLYEAPLRAAVPRWAGALGRRGQRVEASGRLIASSTQQPR